MINSITCLRQKSRKTYPGWPHVPIKPFKGVPPGVPCKEENVKRADQNSYVKAAMMRFGNFYVKGAVYRQYIPNLHQQSLTSHDQYCEDL